APLTPSSCWGVPRELSGETLGSYAPGLRERETLHPRKP
ncbi:hypothetical protein A2U01_0103890, partial [Trifolium medium]|nr:hypothetical protein [Trifolium medium]